MADDCRRDPQMLVLSPRRGRPRASQPKVTVCAWVEEVHYDRLVEIANAERKSVSGLVRELLLVRIK